MTVTLCLGAAGGNGRVRLLPGEYSIGRRATEVDIVPADDKSIRRAAAHSVQLRARAKPRACAERARQPAHAPAQPQARRDTRDRLPAGLSHRPGRVAAGGAAGASASGRDECRSLSIVCAALTPPPSVFLGRQLARHAGEQRAPAKGRVRGASSSECAIRFPHTSGARAAHPPQRRAPVRHLRRRHSLQTRPTARGVLRALPHAKTSPLARAKRGAPRRAPHPRLVPALHPRPRPRLRRTSRGRLAS